MSGNPLAKLTWYVGVRQVASVYSTVDNYATAELALIPDQVKDFKLNISGTCQLNTVTASD